MKTINGVYTSATIFNTNTTAHSIDDYATTQLQNLCDNKAFADSTIRIMPDVHPLSKDKRQNKRVSKT